MSTLAEGTMSIEETARYLNLSVSYLYLLTRRKAVPCLRIGRRVLFQRQTLDQWLAAQAMCRVTHKKEASDV